MSSPRCAKLQKFSSVCRPPVPRGEKHFLFTEQLTVFNQFCPRPLGRPPKAMHSSAPQVTALCVLHALARPRGPGASRHPAPRLALWAASAPRRSARQVLAPTGWRRCPPHARRPGPREAGARRAEEGAGASARPALACSCSARATGRRVCARRRLRGLGWPGARRCEGRPRPGPDPGPGPGPGRRARPARGAGGRTRRGGSGRTHAHTVPEEPSPRLLFPGRTESGSVSPPSAHSPRVSPRGGGSSSAPPAPAPLRGGRRRRRDPRSRFVCSPTRGGGATT